MCFSPARYVKNEFKIRGRRRWPVVTVEWVDVKIVNLRSGFQSSSKLLSRPELTYFVKCRQKLSGSWIPKNYIQLQREKENFDVACLRSS